MAEGRWRIWVGETSEFFGALVRPLPGYVWEQYTGGSSGYLTARHKVLACPPDQGRMIVRSFYPRR